VWGKPDPSLEDTVNGILKFMYRKGIISVRLVRSTRVTDLRAELTIEAHRRGMDCGADASNAWPLLEILMYRRDSEGRTRAAVR